MCSKQNLTNGHESTAEQILKQYKFQKTTFIVGDVCNNPHIGVLSTLDEMSSCTRVLPINGESDMYDLHYNIAILNLPISLILMDLIDLLRSIPGFSSLAFSPAKMKTLDEYSDDKPPPPSFRMKRVQLGMQLDEVTAGKRDVDRYFALVCIHVDRVRLQNRRKGYTVLTVEYIAEMLLNSMREAVNKQELLLSKKVTGDEIKVELAVDCSRPMQPTDPETMDAASCCTKSIKHLIQFSNANEISDDSVCPICLDLYGGFEIITLICSHTFHFHCIGQHILARCPLCRLPIPIPYIRDCYRIKQDRANHCSECGRSDDTSAHLLMCLVCGYVSCPLHSSNHFESTGHGYGIELWGGYGNIQSGFNSSDRELSIHRGQRIWNHKMSSWVQKLIADSTGMHFTEIVSDNKPMPEGDSVCCQELNALCTQFMQALSHSMDSKTEQFQTNLSAIKNKYGGTINLYKEGTDKYKTVVNEYDRERAEIDKKILDIVNKCQSIKDINNETQIAMRQIDEEIKRIDRGIFNAKRGITVQTQTIGDLTFHANARSQFVRASRGNIQYENEIEGSDVGIITSKENLDSSIRRSLPRNTKKK